MERCGQGFAMEELSSRGGERHRDYCSVRCLCGSALVAGRPKTEMALCAQNEMSSEGSRRESPSLIASGAFSYSNHSGLTLHCVHRAGISSCNLRHRHHRLTLSFAGQLHTLYCSITLPDSSSARQHCRTTQDHAVHSRCKIVCGAGVSYHVTNTSCQAHHHSKRRWGY